MGVRSFRKLKMAVVFRHRRRSCRIRDETTHAHRARSCTILNKHHHDAAGVVVVRKAIYGIEARGVTPTYTVHDTSKDGKQPPGAGGTEMTKSSAKTHTSGTDIPMT